MSIYIDPELCRGCGVCVSVCPQDALSILNDKAVLDVLMCDACNLCISNCPEGAISVLPSSVEIIDGVSRSIEAKSDLRPETRATNKMNGFLGSALVFVTQKIAPMVLDSLIDHFDKKAATPSEQPISKNKITGGRAVGRNSTGGESYIGRRRYRHRSGRNKK